MRIRRKKAALAAAIVYMLLAGGSWMFINSYANSFNRLSNEKIVPAVMTIERGRASAEVLGKTLDIDISGINKSSKSWFAAYLAASDEIRSAAYLIALTYGK
ncbi:MAG TPA: hypothetical protein PLH98_14705 [Ruminococcus flavefaciens]|nr:hypothetical protein [Ruminococcus flavefaciens]HQM01780.1 hypothetical protein [Ruminococcus flavefaciens]